MKIILAVLFWGSILIIALISMYFLFLSYGFDSDTSIVLVLAILAIGIVVGLGKK